jgi:Peptidase family M48
MYGFWNNKRIVLFDTLLSRQFNELLKPVWDSFKSAAVQDNQSRRGARGGKRREEKGDEKKGLADDEVLSVMGHELGHWKLWHSFINFVLLEVSLTRVGGLEYDG